MAIYIDAEMLEVTLRTLRHKKPEWFALGGRMLGISLLTAPRLRLHPNIDEDGEDTLHRRNINLITPVRIDFLGFGFFLRIFASVNAVITGENTLTISNLDIEVDSKRGWVSALINKLVLRLFKGSISQTRRYYVPLHKFLGPRMNLIVSSLEVRSVKGTPYYCLVANVGEKDVSVTPAPLPAKLHVTERPEREGSFVLIIPERIINTTLHAIFPGYTHTVKGKDKDKDSSFQLRKKGQINVGPVQVCLDNDGTIEAGMWVNFKKFKVGVKVFDVTHWQRTRVKKFSAGVSVDFCKGEDGHTPRLVISKVDKIKIKLKGKKTPFSKKFRRVIKSASDNVTSILRGRLEGEIVDLFNVPNEVGHVAIKSHELTVLENALVANVQIDVDDEIKSKEDPEDRFWDFEKVAQKTVKPKPKPKPKPKAIEATQPEQSAMDRELAELMKLKGIEAPAKKPPELDKTGGFHLHLRQQGDGIPVVFIHDLGLDLRCWDKQFEHFEAGYKLMAYDWRGMGQSRGGRSPYRMQTLVRDLRELLTMLGIERPVLVGQGMGGAIAVHHAHAHPEATRGIVVCRSPRSFLEPALNVRPWGLLARLSVARLFSKDYVEKHAEVIEAWRARIRANSTLALLCARIASRWNVLRPQTLLTKLQVPVRVICSDEKARGSDEVGRVEISDSAMPMIEHDEEFNKQLESFILGLSTD